METAVVVLPSLGPVTLFAPSLSPEAHVIAVDAGIDHALALGLTISLAVGDFDSVSSAGLASLEATATPVERFPEAKDSSDFELGLAAAVSAGAARIVVIGGRGGRLDHALANLLALASPALASAEVVAYLDRAIVTVIRDDATLHGAPGSLVSLLPVGGPASSVTTEGLAYPLRGEALEPASTRGLSNVFEQATARITLSGGVLLAIQPEPSDVVPVVGSDHSGEAR